MRAESSRPIRKSMAVVSGMKRGPAPWWHVKTGQTSSSPSPVTLALPTMEQGIDSLPKETAVIPEQIMENAKILEMTPSNPIPLIIPSHLSLFSFEAQPLCDLTNRVAQTDPLGHGKKWKKLTRFLKVNYKFI
ncbi:hypothetical protein ACB092_05G254300 [Castanea dentata]